MVQVCRSLSNKTLRSQLTLFGLKPQQAVRSNLAFTTEMFGASGPGPDKSKVVFCLLFHAVAFMYYVLMYYVINVNAFMY